jgi:hypothetical protein
MMHTYYWEWERGQPLSGCFEWCEETTDKGIEHVVVCKLHRVVWESLSGKMKCEQRSEGGERVSSKSIWVLLLNGP